MPGDDVCRVDHEDDNEVCDGDVDVDVALVFCYSLLMMFVVLITKVIMRFAMVMFFDNNDDGVIMIMLMTTLRMS